MHAFETKNLIIKPLSIKDEALFCSLYTDKKIMRHIREPLSIESAKKSFSKTLLNNGQDNVNTWVIIKKSSHEAIGIQTLVYIKNNPYSVEMGIILTRSAQGKLVPEEAISALMEYVFTIKNYHKVVAEFNSKNLATARFVKKIGFSLDSTFIKNNINYTVCSFERTLWNSNLITKILG